jgi:hypothetical protein
VWKSKVKGEVLVTQTEIGSLLMESGLRIRLCIESFARTTTRNSNPGDNNQFFYISLLVIATLAATENS